MPQRECALSSGASLSQAQEAYMDACMEDHLQIDDDFEAELGSHVFDEDSAGRASPRRERGKPTS